MTQLKTSLAKALNNLDLHGVSVENNLINKIWSIGPKKCGPNILLNLTDYSHPDFWDIKSDNVRNENEVTDPRKDYNSSFINGFQLATAAGPLCEEPMQGVCFAILEWKVENETELNSNVFGPFSGNEFANYLVCDCISNNLCVLNYLQVKCYHLLRKDVEKLFKISLKD